MSLKNKPLHLSLLLAGIELVIWLLLGVLSTPSGKNIYVALLGYSAETFGEIAIAIATTFYVVFTYRLLANSEAQRKSSTQPYLTIRWYQGAQSTDIVSGQKGVFAEKARGLLSRLIGPNAIEESNMATGDRYLILELSNVRETPAGWIKIAFNGILEIPGVLKTELRDSLDLQNLTIGMTDKVEVTMVDLFPIPQSGKVTLNIEVIAYGAVDGGDVVDEVSGDLTRSGFGEFMPTAADDLQPN